MNLHIQKCLETFIWYDTGGENLGVGPMPLLGGKQTFKTKHKYLLSVFHYLSFTVFFFGILKAIMLLYYLWKSLKRHFVENEFWKITAPLTPPQICCCLCLLCKAKVLLLLLLFIWTIFKEKSNLKICLQFIIFTKVPNRELVTLLLFHGHQ